MISRLCHLAVGSTISLGFALMPSLAAAQGEGLKVSSETWPRWQARIGIVAQTPDRQAVQLGASGSIGETTRAAALLGDYYFTGSGFDPQRVSGGLRATTGWLFGGNLALGATQPSASSALSVSLLRRPGLDDTQGARHSAYVGVGYTGLATRGGWGINADLGLLGSPLHAGGQRLDSDITVRDYRLAPAARLGVSYSF
jgi:hypothetical protein